MIRQLLVTLSFLLLVVGIADAQERSSYREEHDNSWKNSSDVPALLQKAIREQKSGRYVGRLTREFQKGNQNLKHDEILYRDGPRTRIEFPSGSKYAGQLIVETANDRKYYKPVENVLYVFPPTREENYGRLVGLARRAAEKSISLTLETGERIAGIATQQVAVHDRFNTITQRLYIDPISGVVLKRTVFDKLGVQTGYFQFNEINLNPGNFDASLFQLNKPTAQIVTPADTLRQIASAEGFDPVMFPSTTGLRLEQSRVTTVQRDKVLVESFGSNRGRVTLFELKSSVSPERLKSMARGENQVYSWQRNGKWFVLIGPKTEQQLAQQAQTLYTGTP